ncbi:MAG: pyrroline-5-carboxylate reductase, partial [Elusimicrobia bacterium]|nr:pyrroline-5-carboxylate reductase [Elusimicrobiota bacterium]
MTKKTITIIGCGKMGLVIFKAINRLNIYTVNAIEKDKSLRAELKDRYALNAYISFSKAGSMAGISDIYIFAVKPKDIPDVAAGLLKMPKAGSKKILIISIAAGVKSKDIKKRFKDNVSVIRVMPNTPALVSEGLTAIGSNSGASEKDLELAKSIFSRMGDVILINSDKFDAITALSGSGPAYFFYMAEIMQDYAISRGFKPRQAALIAVQTIFGSAQLMKKEYQNGDKSFSQLRRDVTSKGGTTEAALNNMDEEDFKGIFKRALEAADVRSKEMSKGKMSK